MKVEVEAAEKKKRKKTTAKSSSSLSFSSLPDDITENCLARISRSYYPTLSLVSKTCRSLFSSTELYTARSRLGYTEQCLFICLQGLYTSYHEFQWITCCLNRTKTKRRKKSIGQLSVPIPSSNFPTDTNPTVVGSEIYILGGYEKRSSNVRVLDCLSHTWRDAPNMNVPRRNPLSCAYDGKIYVMGGAEGDGSLGEVFDIKNQTWEHLPKPCFAIARYLPDDLYVEELEGKIYFGDGCYDPKQCRWENKSATTDGSECVIDNVAFFFSKHGGRYNFWWNDLSFGGVNEAKEVKGLVSLGNRYKRNGGTGDTTTKTFSSGGKLYVLWEECRKKKPNKMLKIWCAEISVEMRDGDEIWGNVESFDVVHTTLSPYRLLHCLAVSV